jgi:hypothetical protein
MNITRKCQICKREIETTSAVRGENVCYDCFGDGSYQAELENEQYQNRKEHLAFRKNECDDCTDPALYADDEDRQAWEDAEDNRLWTEAFHQEQLEQADNDESSGSTDLGNRGGTTFCW